MRLSPLDIRKQDFKRVLRGFDVEEVQAFLQMLSNEWEEMQSEARRLETKLKEHETKLKHYERVEEALQEALKTAREASRQAHDTARKKTRILLDEAEAQAEEIRRSAEHERLRIRREAAGLSGRRDEIVARLRAFLMSELELLARFDGREPADLIQSITPGSGPAAAGAGEEPAVEDEPAPEPVEEDVPLPPYAMMEGELSLPAFPDDDRADEPIFRSGRDADTVPEGEPGEREDESRDSAEQDSPSRWSFMPAPPSTSDRARNEKHLLDDTEDESFASELELERIRRLLKDLG
jgi:cell division initiation protein